MTQQPRKLKPRTIKEKLQELRKEVAETERVRDSLNESIRRVQFKQCPHDNLIDVEDSNVSYCRDCGLYYYPTLREWRLDHPDYDEDLYK